MQDGQNTASGVQLVEIGPEHKGQRIDNFLLRLAAGVPRSHVYRIIRKGQVRVNGGRVKPTRKLDVGDIVRVPPLSMKAKAVVSVPDAVAARVSAAVVDEQEDFLVLNKPAGLAVHGGSGLAFGLIDALRQAREEPKLELVHRLDRGTSGCLLVAKNAGVARQLQALFRSRTVNKQYLALTDGIWQQSAQTVTARLVSNQSHAGERRVMVQADGQEAVSHFETIETYSNSSLVKVSIDTGRTHQIRVHANHCGHPVIGDTRYGGNEMNAQYKRRGLGRMYLHASSLAFDWQGQQCVFTAGVEKDWEQAVQELSGAK